MTVSSETCSRCNVLAGSGCDETSQYGMVLRGLGGRGPRDPDLSPVDLPHLQSWDPPLGPLSPRKGLRILHARPPGQNAGRRTLVHGEGAWEPSKGQGARTGVAQPLGFGEVLLGDAWHGREGQGGKTRPWNEV